MLGRKLSFLYGLFCCCPLLGQFLLFDTRQNIRDKCHGIPTGQALMTPVGKPADPERSLDGVISCFFPCCALIQEAQELEAYNKRKNKKDSKKGKHKTKNKKPHAASRSETPTTTEVTELEAEIPDVKLAQDKSQTEVSSNDSDRP